MKPVLVVKSSVQQQYLDYLEDMMYNTHPAFHSMRVQPAEYSIPAEARELTTPENVNFKESLANFGRDTRLPLSITELGHTEPLRGRHVYPFSAFSMQPNLMNAGVDADLPRSYKIGRQNKIRDLQMYGFEGKENTPQRYANNAQTEGIIYGDVDESQITPIMPKPYKYHDMRHAANSLLPSSGYTPADLPQKPQKIARVLMDMGVPPLLMDEHMRPQNISDPTELGSYRDDTRQWSQNQQRLNIPTEDLLYASEPMEIAMRLLKEESQGQLYNEDLFEGFLGADDLIHYDEMNDKQRAIIHAKMALPPHLFTEGSEIGEYMNPFLFSRSMYNKIPDYHYDDELEYLQHYKDAMESGNFVNDNEKTRLLDGNESHPEHPHSVAMSRMHPDFKNRIGMINRLYKASEPMDIAFQLLKEDPLHLQPSNTLARRAREELETDKMGENSPAYQEMMERMMETYEPQDETIPLEENLDQYAQETGKNPWRMLPGREIPNNYGGTAKVHLDPLTPIHPQQFYDWQAKNASEPMEIAMQLLKERVSPEAKRHKLEYDKKYESSPERVKYREDLNRERRRRGIYGSHDHKDISHTEGGKLTLEGEHENRARHFKDKGTLREL